MTVSLDVDAIAKYSINVYVAGPLFSSGLAGRNIRTTCEYAHDLLERGFAPFIPHLYFYWDQIIPQPEEIWLGLDRAWLLRCDALLRIEGKSRGSDLEVQWANEAGIPVYFINTETAYEVFESMEADRRTGALVSRNGPWSGENVVESFRALYRSFKAQHPVVVAAIEAEEVAEQ